MDVSILRSCFKISKVGIYLLVLCLPSCVSYQSKISKARDFIAKGQPNEAIGILEPKAQETGKDQVLFLLDYGMALHLAKDFKKSNEIFLRADQLADVKDYVSLSREAGSLLTSQRLIQYKSERFENILINAYLALNYLMLSHYEEALVECRRIDEKLQKLKFEGEKASKNFFARYLSAMIWEAQGQWDSAYIDYKAAYDINSNRPFLSSDLVRAAWRSRRSADLKKWQKLNSSETLEDIKKQTANKGEFVFIYQQGWIPRKKARPENFRFPYLVAQSALDHQVHIQITGQPTATARLMYDVGRDAIQTMEDGYQSLVANRVAGYVAKRVVADQIRQKNEGLGLLAAVAMHISDQADLRQWSTLPGTFQLSRQWLLPGDYHVVVKSDRGAIIWENDIVIVAGRPTFATARSF